MEKALSNGKYSEGLMTKDLCTTAKQFYLVDFTITDFWVPRQLFVCRSGVIN